MLHKAAETSVLLVLYLGLVDQKEYTVRSQLASIKTGWTLDDFARSESCRDTAITHRLDVVLDIFIGALMLALIDSGDYKDSLKLTVCIPQSEAEDGSGCWLADFCHQTAQSSWTGGF